MRAGLGLAAAVLLFGAAGAMLAAAGLLRTPAYHASVWRPVAAYALAGAIGMAAGFAELAARYRDAPVAVAAGRAGTIYLVANGTLAAIGLMLLDRYPAAFGVASTDTLLRVLAAGTGTMLLMRSTLFRLKRGNGEDLAFGPAVVIESLMAMVNREVDRDRARRRLQMVVERAMRLKGHDFTVSAQFVSASMLAFQDLDPEARERLTQVLNRLETDLAALPPMIKYAAVGFELLTVAGDGMFAAVMDALEAFHGGNATPPATGA